MGKNINFIKKVKLTSQKYACQNGMILYFQKILLVSVIYDKIRRILGCNQIGIQNT